MSCLTTLQISRWFRFDMTGVLVTVASTQMLPRNPVRVAMQFGAASGTLTTFHSWGRDAVEAADFRYDPTVDSPPFFHMRDYGSMVQESLHGETSAMAHNMFVLEITATEELLNLSESEIRKIIFGGGNK